MYSNSFTIVAYNSKSENRKQTMRYIKPSYFDNFKCAADQCPDTCCAGWQIMIDDRALEQYMQTEGAFGSRLINGIDWQDGSFLQYAGRCSMLNDNNLCDLVTELGESSLCETCQRYPRHVEEFEGLREWSLSLSCPIAAQMILDSESPFDLIEIEDEEEEPLAEEFEDFDLLLFTQLEDARKVLFEILQNREIKWEKRLGLMLEFGWEMQCCIEEERFYDMDNLIASYAKKEYDGNEDEKHRFLELQKHFAVFEQLERLREEWSDILEAAGNTLFENYEDYRLIRQAFLAEYGSGAPKHLQWQRYLENITGFFLYTYFCGAAYDDWIYSKVALAVFSVSFIEEFVMCRWFLADKNISWQECVELAYRYAREVEHSDENLNILEEWLQENSYAMKGTEH